MISHNPRAFSVHCPLFTVHCFYAVTSDLKKDMKAMYDDTASIGRLYRRQDEIGTPYCITVDVDSLSDHKVTVRDRDSMKQDRVSVDKVKEYVVDKISV